MNPLVLLPLLAAATLAAPGNLVQSGLIGGNVLTYAAVPQVATVQVPLTKTVHYETKPVVTGYSTSIIKPAIATGIAQAPALIAPQQQVIVQGTPTVFRQLPPLPNFPPPAFPTPSPNGTADAPGFPALPDFPAFPPGGDNPADSPQPPMAPQLPGLPAFPTLPPPSTTPAPTQAPPPAEGGNKQRQQLLFPQVAGLNFFPNVFNPSVNIVSTGQAQQVAPIQQVQSDDAVIVSARSNLVQVPQQVAVQQVAVPQVAVQQVAAPVQQVVSVRAAQAGDFEPLVTKEKVLAPVRTHTQITPQVTQVQPEVTVRKVVQEINVAQPIAVQTPVVRSVVGQQIVGVGPQFVGQQVLGQQVLGQQVLNGQVLNGQVLNGQVLNGQVLNGQVINGQVLNGQFLL